METLSQRINNALVIPLEPCEHAKALSPHTRSMFRLMFLHCSQHLQSGTDRAAACWFTRIGLRPMFGLAQPATCTMPAADTSKRLRIASAMFSLAAVELQANFNIEHSILVGSCRLLQNRI